MSELLTTVEKIRAALDAEDGVGALRLAKGMVRLGIQKDAIERGWAAHTNPDFYRSLHCNPDALVSQGIAAVRERFQDAE